MSRASYQIQIHNPDTAKGADESILRKAVIETLRRFRVPRAELSVALLNDQELADLHLHYLGVEGPTDVLTFDLSAPGPGRTLKEGLAGEVVISYDTARRCAQSRGHDPAAEMALYTVHGVLHLLGLTDHNEEEAHRMHSLEDEILTAVGLGRIYGE